MTDEADWHHYTEKPGNNDDKNREAREWPEDVGGWDTHRFYIKEETDGQQNKVRLRENSTSEEPGKFGNAWLSQAFLTEEAGVGKARADLVRLCKGPSWF